jgi:hypothetical protein
MNRPALWSFILPLVFVWGCGQSPSESKFVSPPHGGSFLALPESQGTVELKNERGAPQPKGSRKAQSNSRIIAYFYGPDSTAAMSPAPTDVRVTLGAAGSGTVVNLAPQPNEPGAFASEPGIYPDELRGQIDLQLNGKPVQAPFSFR